MHEEIKKLKEVLKKNDNKIYLLSYEDFLVNSPKIEIDTEQGKLDFNIYKEDANLGLIHIPSPDDLTGVMLHKDKEGYHTCQISYRTRGIEKEVNFTLMIKKP